MSSPKSIIVNCGATQVGVAVFSSNAGRLTLERLVIENLDYDYAGEDAWLGALSVALGGIVRGLKISGPASVVIPGYLLLTKSIKVPQVEKAKQAQIIGFEAQNQIPFPLNEVVWDSQIIATDGVEAEVMLFALKQDAAARIAGVVAGSGLTPSVLQASTLLDYQGWRAANPGDTDEVLIINIGARTTNMTFVNAAGFSVHNVNVGGNLLTQSISDTLALPFSKAEAIKVAHFSGLRPLADADPHANALTQNAQSFMRRISQEVTKRIVIYKRQNQNRQPARIILTGRGSLLPGLSEHLCETQRISVDYFDPFSAFSAAPVVDPGYLEGCRVSLSETLGEASRSVLPGAVGVNLLPASLENQMAFSRQKPLLVAAAALFAIAPWPVWHHFNTAAQAAVSEVSAVEKRAAELLAFRSSIETAKGDASRVAARVASLSAAAKARDNWREFLADLQTRIMAVKDVWIEDLRFSRVPAQVAEGAPPSDVCRVTVQFCMLIKEVAPDGAFNGAAVQAKRREIKRALEGSPFVEKIPDDAEKSDLKRANLPRITFTLVIKDQKPL